MPKRSGLLTSLLTLIMLVTSPMTIFAKNVYVGGQNIGIELKSNGLLISGTYDVKQQNKTYNPKSNSDLRKGDLIISVGEDRVNSLNDLVTILKEKYANEDSAPITILRDGITYKKNLKLIKDEFGNIKTGLFIKERLLGIGTITYYDPENKSYGALGHEMNDASYSPSIDLSFGTIYASDVTLIRKSKDGAPGEKIASINEDEILGEVTKNNEYGIYGKYTVNVDDYVSLEVGDKDDVKLGKAQIWTVIHGDKVEKFDIEIVSVKSQEKQSIKGISFKIVDKRLLNITNGIVAGMSGSPIIQDNKIIGAVTHVLVDKVEYGYGIFIEWMLEESNNL